YLIRRANETKRCLPAQLFIISGIITSKGEPMARRLVLVHGYSASAQAFHPVRDMLKQLPGGKQIVDINICNYISLNNEITIKDIAEGFDRALCLQPGLNNGEEFDAIVHSTGMLVVRA